MKLAEQKGIFSSDNWSPIISVKILKSGSILPPSSSKVVPKLSVFLNFKCKASSRYSLLRVLPILSSKSVLTLTFFCIFKCNQALATVSCACCRSYLPKVFRHWPFFAFSSAIKLSLQSRAHFADLIFPKCSEPDNFSTFSEPRGRNSFSRHTEDAKRSKQDSLEESTGVYVLTTWDERCKASNVNPNFKSQRALTCQMLNQRQNPNAVKRFTLRGCNQYSGSSTTVPILRPWTVVFCISMFHNMMCKWRFCNVCPMETFKGAPKAFEKTSEYRSVTFLKQARTAPISHSRW